MSLWTLRLDDFRDRTASRAPTPGGGSVAAVCATLGTGLFVMAADLTAAAPSPPPALAPLAARARALVSTLADAADADVAAFDAFMAALALPRASDADKAARKLAIAAAARAASEAPLAAAAAMLEALDLARSLEPLVKPSVVSDVLAGADLVRGAAVAMLRNVDINLPHVADDETRRALGEHRDQILRALR